MNKIDIENKIKSIEEELKQLKEELNKEEKGYFKPRANEQYYCVNCDKAIKYKWFDMNCDNMYYKNANCFKTKEEAERVAFEQTLFRKIRRFRDTYDEEKTYWNNKEYKYYIRYEYSKNKVVVDFITSYRDFGNVYFTSKEVAERCLEEFKKDLEKYFTGNY